MVPTGVCGKGEPSVKSQNYEHVKYVWNVYCVAGITNHGQDLQPQKTKKHVEFPSVMEQICFISKGLK